MHVLNPPQEKTTGAYWSVSPQEIPTCHRPTSACRRVWALLRALELSLATKTNTLAWHVDHVGILWNSASFAVLDPTNRFLSWALGGAGTTRRMLVLYPLNVLASPKFKSTSNDYRIPPARVSTHQSRLRSTDSHAANTSALAKATKAVMLHLSHPQSATISPLWHFCPHRLSP